MHQGRYVLKLYCFLLSCMQQGKSLLSKALSTGTRRGHGNPPMKGSIAKEVRGRGGGAAASTAHATRPKGRARPSRAREILRRSRSPSQQQRRRQDSRSSSRPRSPTRLHRPFKASPVRQQRPSRKASPARLHRPSHQHSPSSLPQAANPRAAERLRELAHGKPKEEMRRDRAWQPGGDSIGRSRAAIEGRRLKKQLRSERCLDSPFAFCWCFHFSFHFSFPFIYFSFCWCLLFFGGKNSVIDTPDTFCRHERRQARDRGESVSSSSAPPPTGPLKCQAKVTLNRPCPQNAPALCDFKMCGSHCPAVLGTPGVICAFHGSEDSWSKGKGKGRGKRGSGDREQRSRSPAREKKGGCRGRDRQGSSGIASSSSRRHSRG